MAWTLEYGGVSQSLADWGLGTDLALARRNMAVDVLTVWGPGDAVAEGLFVYGAEGIFRRADGSVYFRGRFRRAQHVGSGGTEGITYEFAGPWWDFERVVMQHQWSIFDHYTVAGDPTTAPVYVNQYCSELFLGISQTLVKQTSGDVIAEAVDWAIACGVGVTRGTIDAAADIPVSNTRDVTVAEVIIQMLRWTPDVICWFDYATSPPTFYARNAANLANADVVLGTDRLRELRLEPRYDLQLPGVVLRFKSVHEVNGKSWIQVVTDKYPSAVSESALGVPVHTVELDGGRLTTVSTEVVCAAINAQSGTEATRIAWWKKKERLLNSTRVRNISITSAEVKDEDLNDVSLATYPNELVSGQLADWMGYSSVRVSVQAMINYELDVGPDGSPHWKSRSKLLAVNLLGTNAVSGTYESVESYESAEPTPVGLAQAIYEAHAGLQWEGQLDLVAGEVPAGLGLGRKVTIVGGLASWSGLLVQECVEEPAWGRMRLSLGPASQLGLSDLIELLRVNRYRRVYNASSSRSGGAQGSGEVALGNQTPVENTTGEPLTSEGGEMVLYRIKSVQADYLTCRTWDGTTEGGSDVYIAKPWKLRNASVLTSETVAGISHTYTETAGLDANNVNRLDNDGTNSEEQRIVPPWTVNEEIYAMDVDHTTVEVSGTELTKMYVSPARQWAKIYEAPEGFSTEN